MQVARRQWSRTDHRERERHAAKAFSKSRMNVHTLEKNQRSSRIGGPSNCGILTSLSLFICPHPSVERHLNKIALRLNQRPRKTLGFETPADKLRAVLH